MPACPFWMNDSGAPEPGGDGPGANHDGFRPDLTAPGSISRPAGRGCRRTVSRIRDRLPNVSCRTLWGVQVSVKPFMALDGCPMRFHRREAREGPTRTRRRESAGRAGVECGLSPTARNAPPLRPGRRRGPPRPLPARPLPVPATPRRRAPGAGAGPRGRQSRCRTE